MRVFRHLRFLELSADLLLGETSTKGRWDLIPEGIVQELPPPRRLPSGTPQALKSLPAKLQELRLVFDGGFERASAFQTMFAGLHRTKPRLLPKLAKVTLCYSQRMDVVVEAIAEDLRAAGVEVTMDLQEEPRSLQ